MSAIVALAKVQKGFSGSSQYWPLAGTPTVTFDEFEIKLTSEVPLPYDIVKRTFELKNTALDGAVTAEDAAAVGGAAKAATGNVRPIMHLYYPSFPNYGVPDSTEGLKLLLREVEKVLLSEIEWILNCTICLRGVATGNVALHWLCGVVALLDYTMGYDGRSMSVCSSPLMNLPLRC